MANDQKVETSSVLWDEVCDSAEPNRKKIDEATVVYEFGSGKVRKTEGKGAYDTAG